MPSFAITRRERSFPIAVSETNSASPSSSNAYQTFSRAPFSKPRAPVFCRESPANLDARSERRLKSRHSQPDESDKLATLGQFRCAQSETMGPEVRFDSVSHFVAPLPRHPLAQIFHHARIGVHPRKRLPVRLVPFPQDQPLGFQRHHVYFRGIYLRSQLR